ncbi:MAG TPA: PHP domain-containing protein [Actinomycetota bacterium]|nr:PHP domain-containing protein [Actinomycetota bacterium]
MTLANGEIAELLSGVAARAEGHRARAYRRAAHHAITWPEEASDVVEAGHPLTVLPGVGDRLAARIGGWLEDPPEVPEPPPERAGFSTFAAARATVRAHPEWRAELRGDHQMHTHHSDGHASVAEMARASIALGHRHAVVTDHSGGLKIANGMDEARVDAQGTEIAAVNAQLAGDGFRVLHGLETNLSVTGEPDMDAAFLARLDVVLGSFHSQLRVDGDQTARYVAALSARGFHVLGHPRCRMYDRRVGLHADWERVFAAARDHGKAIEIDCHPNRQDVDVDLARLAAEAGVWISIGTDAHDEAELRFVDLGLATAIDAGIPRERILNYMDADELLAWARDRR